tara:strand:- start:210 stop:461 length:252 start_codon:yes stop_codon:yes gene_type:complete
MSKLFIIGDTPNPDMAERLFKIRVNSTESNKDLGFEILANSELNVICLANEEYVVPEIAINLLKSRGVIYDLLSINGEEVNAP